MSTLYSAFICIKVKLCLLLIWHWEASVHSQTQYCYETCSLYPWINRNKILTLTTWQNGPVLSQTPYWYETCPSYPWINRNKISTFTTWQNEPIPSEYTPSVYQMLPWKENKNINKNSWTYVIWVQKIRPIINQCLWVSWRQTDSVMETIWFYSKIYFWCLHVDISYCMKKTKKVHFLPIWNLSYIRWLRRNMLEKSRQSIKIVMAHNMAGIALT